MKHLLIWLLLTGLLPGGRLSAQTQTGTDGERRYRAALKLMQLGEYKRATAELETLVQRDESWSPYAMYYLADIAFRQKDYANARLRLKEITDRYPNWRKLDDVRYLFACAAMETGQYEDALTRLQRIGDPAMKAGVETLEQHFLALVTDLNRLKAMQREFPANRNVALALIGQLQRNPADTSNLALADKLARQFGVATTGMTVSRPAPATSVAVTGPVAGTAGQRPLPAGASGRNRAKGYYNVAVMFPFRVGDVEGVQRGRSNQYVYDMFEGIRLAREKLLEEGVTINLFAYDIDSDASKTVSVISNPAFRQTDLIIGPLYAEPNRLVTDFAGPGGIPVVNPISTSSELITNQPMAFLAQPSLVQQADKVVAFARTLPAVRRVAVYFGTARKDSLLAVEYRLGLKKQGIQVIDFRKIGASTDAIAAGMTMTDAGKPNCILLASTGDDDGPRLLEALSRRSINCPVIATATAFDEYRNPLSTFTRHELYLLYPDYVDSSRPEVTDFDETYLIKRNIIPSVYASQGYDLMLFFGRLLAKNAFQDRSRINLRSDTSDYILSGFDYTQSNDNQIVTIVKVSDGHFVKVND